MKIPIIADKDLVKSLVERLAPRKVTICKGSNSHRCGCMQFEHEGKNYVVMPNDYNVEDLDRARHSVSHGILSHSCFVNYLVDSGYSPVEALKEARMVRDKVPYSECSFN